MLTLYDFSISGNCYKVRLLLSMMSLPYERIEVDLRGGETKTEAFKQINPRGQVPVLIDGDQTIWDSMAILAYLARQYGDDTWLPIETMDLTHVMQWLALSENELLYGLARSRGVLFLKRDFNLAQCQAEAHTGLSTMDAHLAKNKWLATANPTIADIACYPYISLAHQGDVSLDNYAHVRRWVDDFEALPRWIPLET